jgi:uncharacterized protein DUF4416
MGEITVPEPARLVVGVIHSDSAALEAAAADLQEYLGTVSLAGAEMDFSWTTYYEKEMGAGLKRCFLTADKLVPRQLLADIKLLTNRIELDLARDDGTRRINLDPGLLTAENFILASTKNYGHRIYLRDGIFAEVTLRYIKGCFQVLEWTYPDYRSDKIRDILEKIRKEYMQVLRGNPKILAEVKK